MFRDINLEPRDNPIKTARRLRGIKICRQWGGANQFLRCLGRIPRTRISWCSWDLPREFFPPVHRDEKFVYSFLFPLDTRRAFYI